MNTREEKLAWCKERALEIVDAGDFAGAVASMLSDLNKQQPPLYDAAVLSFLAMDGMMFCKTEQQVRHWIEGFQ